MLDEYLTVREAAAAAGVSRRIVHRRIEDGSVPAQCKGNQYFILKSDLHKVIKHPIGNPNWRRREFRDKL